MKARTVIGTSLAFAFAIAIAPLSPAMQPDRVRASRERVETR